MTATSRKQGACFPAELWEAIKRQAEAENITPSKVIVQAVREMVERKSKRRARK
jgi:predicted transcriptional regulator